MTLNPFLKIPLLPAMQASRYCFKCNGDSNSLRRVENDASTPIGGNLDQWAAYFLFLPADNVDIELENATDQLKIPCKFIRIF